MSYFVYFIKCNPFLRWVVWGYQTYKLKKNNPTLVLGNLARAVGCTFGHRNIIYENSVLVNTKLGDYTYVGGHVKIQYATIGKFCSIAEGVRIGLGIHPTNLESTHPAFYSPQSHWLDEITPDLSLDIVEYKPIIIGDDVWIGTNAMILDGVIIGNHAIIAAGAVVTKSVPDYAIVGGVPARAIGRREQL